MSEVDKQEILLSSLFRIVREIHTNSDPAKLPEMVLQSVVESLHAERGYLFLKGEDGKMEVSAALQLNPDEVGGLGKTTQTAIKRAVEKGEVVITEDARQDPRFAGASSIIMHDIRSVASVPLRLGDEIIGALYLDSRLGENSFSEQSGDALLLFGSLAAQAIDQAQTVAALIDENARLRIKAGRFAFEEIIGQSKAMEQVFALMERVSQTDLPVLIQGESGTGKELIARAIHRVGPRGEKPFLALFAGNLGEELLESELFGHVKGSFTGAHQDKPGLLSLASGGTLMLDEVADIPLRIQAKLLRVLQDGQYKPVGGLKNLSTDVRIVSATHSDLPIRVKENLFREDLYYRINGIEIRVPPLRERRDDILLIAEKILRRFSEQSNRGHIRFSRESLTMLTRAKWPGNVRELERTVERAVVLCPGLTITADHLIFTRSAAGDEGPEDLSLKAAEKNHILRILAESAGNRSEASRTLGISRRYLQNLIKEWKDEGIEV
ncbi:MAG: sigma-54-dependent Fis family transcriptional regulator [Candidatus Electryonea clarkiae]|nr:sigma-54-dependent Fis family transcriptional regulator [Candidatus Electryonea clarkiae]MDP8288809.1 sigma-54-dependent Fis family transcriptional regulator [Candidatus Electryonea clarkiae]